MEDSGHHRMGILCQVFLKGGEAATTSVKAHLILLTHHSNSLHSCRSGKCNGCGKKSMRSGRRKRERECVRAGGKRTASGRERLKIRGNRA